LRAQLILPLRWLSIHKLWNLQIFLYVWLLGLSSYYKLIHVNKILFFIILRPNLNSCRFTRERTALCLYFIVFFTLLFDPKHINPHRVLKFFLIVISIKFLESLFAKWFWSSRIKADAFLHWLLLRIRKFIHF